MGSGERVEIDWGDIVEKLALVEDADQVSTNESTKAVPSNGELCHDAPGSLEFFDFFEDLKQSNGFEQQNRVHAINRSR